MSVFFAIVAVSVIFGLIALLVRAETRKRNAAWSEVASRFDGRFDPKNGPWYQRKPLIEVQAQGQSVTVDQHMVGDVAHTRVRAMAPGAGNVELRVYPQHALTRLGRALGFQDIETGDAAFDEAFVVKANNEDLARAWLTDEVRDAIRAASGYAFTLKKGELSVMRPVLDKDVDALTAAVNSTALVAAAGRRIREDWERFAQSHESVVAADRLRIDVEDASVPIRIEAEGIEAGRRTMTRIETRVVGGKGEAYAISAEEEAASLPETVQRRIARLGPARIESDGERVTVLLPGLETDRERLEQACELATELADQQSATYR